MRVERELPHELWLHGAGVDDGHHGVVEGGQPEQEPQAVLVGREIHVREGGGVFARLIFI